MSYLHFRFVWAKTALCSISLIAAFSAAQLKAQNPGQFQVVGRFKNIGMVLASVVGPGPVHGSQRIYASIAYYAGTFDILAIDPDTGATTVLHSPVGSESGVWNMVLGPDGNIYMGTAPTAHLLKLQTSTGTVRDLGVPSPGEEYIWAVDFGSDHRLYAGTYPHCKLVRYDPSTGRLADLGRLDSTQQYARYLIASRDGFLYAGIGSAAARVVAYQISSGKMQQLLPEAAQVPGFAHAYTAADGNVYVQAPSLDFRISQWQAIEIPENMVPDPAPPNVLADGRVATLDEENGALFLHVHSAAGDSVSTIAVNYAGEANQLFRIGLGPDGHLYGSGALPSDLVRINGNGKMTYIGSLGNGEVYTMLPVGSNLLLGTYADTSTLVSFNPALPFNAGASSKNPQSIAVPEGDICWRPEAMVAGRDGIVYVGAQASYGELGGPLIAWNPANGAVKHSSAIPNQGVVSLAAWKDLIVGGTTIQGGPGSQPVTTEAQLFLWDPKEEGVIWKGVPVPGAHTITDLIAAPNGLVYGFADTTLFEFDPSVPAVTGKQRSRVSGLIYNSIGIDKTGRIWGLSSQGIFTVDPVHLGVTMRAVPPAAITGGFAMSGGKIYFIAGTAVYSYGLPEWGFTLKNASSSASVTAGGAAQSDLTVTSVGGFQGTVLFSCAGLPEGAACSFSPGSLASSGTSHLTISTTASTATAALGPSRGAILGFALPCFWMAFAGLAKGRIQLSRMLLVLLILGVVHVFSGCASVTLTPGFDASASKPTPPGTYTITVSATGAVGASSMTQTSQIALTVK